MHLVAYEEAAKIAEDNPTPANCAKAGLAALEVVRHKNSKRLAWRWANWAVEWAQEAGLAVDESILGSGRWPETEALRRLLEDVVLGDWRGELPELAAELRRQYNEAKLAEEWQEFEAAYPDDPMWVTEAADVYYYAVKLDRIGEVERLSEITGLPLPVLRRIAEAKYRLRVQRGRFAGRDDEAELAACRAVLERHLKSENE